MQTTVHTPSAPGGFPGAAKPPARAQKLALAAVAGAVVLLSVVAALVVFKGRSSTPDAAAEATSSTAPAPARSASPTAKPAPVASAAPVAAAAPASAAVPASADPAPTTKVASGGAKSPGPAKVDPAPDPTPAPAGGDMGTLVAISVGGACAFTVNGAAQGFASTLKLSLKPGTYSVTCAPAFGGAKSKSVTVTGGGTATAMFKL